MAKGFRLSAGVYDNVQRSHGRSRLIDKTGEANSNQKLPNCWASDFSSANEYWLPSV